MKFFPSGIREFSKTKQTSHGPSCIRDSVTGLCCEEFFMEMLTLERKRTERSKKPFLLMLLDIGKILMDDRANEVLKKLSHVLFSVTRETDLKGWYRNGSTIGVIFTEINGLENSLLKEKIVTHLSAVLNHTQVREVGITTHCFPEVSDDGMSGNGHDMNLYPDLRRRNSSGKTSQFLKRALDIAGAITALLIFSPFFLIIPLLIKLSSKGPVLFRQERIGQYGKRFTFLKFRSMYTDCDHEIHKEYVRKLICEKKSYDTGTDDTQNRIYKIKDDPRITPVGIFLRKTSLDELPQFLNVLKGEMSLVGPRLPIPYELENYDIWHRRRILEIKPGITGLWQVNGRSRTSFDEMVRLDVRYIKERSLWLDINILLRTPLAVFSGKGAY
jgi:lipopolysaccharide/colanic/teichoic acid biosynthesis glycosyltransferase